MTVLQALTVLNMIETHGSLPTEAKKIAIKALDKQIPKKPKTMMEGFTFTGCPVCDTVVNTDYCPNCGQAINWED